jgi:hypothetical protein
MLSCTTCLLASMCWHLQPLEVAAGISKHTAACWQTGALRCCNQGPGFKGVCTHLLLLSDVPIGAHPLIGIASVQVFSNLHFLPFFLQWTLDMHTRLPRI